MSNRFGNKRCSTRVHITIKLNTILSNLRSNGSRSTWWLQLLSRFQQVLALLCSHHLSIAANGRIQLAYLCVQSLASLLLFKSTKERNSNKKYDTLKPMLNMKVPSFLPLNLHHNRRDAWPCEIHIHPHSGLIS